MQDLTSYNNNQQNTQENRENLILSSEAIFFKGVYMWMFSGLLITSLVAYGTANFALGLIFSRTTGAPTPLYYIAAISTIAIVFFLSYKINTLSSATAKIIFIVYASLMGVTFTGIALAYPTANILKAFIATSSLYGAMAIYGLVTKRSLQGWGSFLFMGLIGIIVVSVLNIFIKSSGINLILPYVVVLIFAGLTAYDHQKLRVIHANGFDNSDQRGKSIIMGALTLYLDFINLFLAILRILNRN